MAVLSQSAADALIDKIDKAILKHSVSNRDVAAVLGFLNYILKSGESDKFLRKDVEDSRLDPFPQGNRRKGYGSHRGSACCRE